MKRGYLKGLLRDIAVVLGWTKMLVEGLQDERSGRKKDSKERTHNNDRWERSSGIKQCTETVL